MASLLVVGSYYTFPSNSSFTDMFTVWSALIDFSLALLPWKILWVLQMRTAEKVGVMVAMSLGLLYPRFPNPSPPKTLRLIHILQIWCYFNYTDNLPQTAYLQGYIL